jgi:hypothetical protein
MVVLGVVVMAVKHLQVRWVVLAFAAARNGTPFAQHLFRVVVALPEIAARKALAKNAVKPSRDHGIEDVTGNCRLGVGTGNGMAIASHRRLANRHFVM